MTMNTVRRRAMSYIQSLVKLGYTNELPRDQAIDLFNQITDQWDRLTIKAYFGTIAHQSKRQYYQDSQYTTGTISHKTITLSQRVSASKGYLEKLGLVTFYLKGLTTFMRLETAILVPQLEKESEIKNETLSMENLSLSPIALKIPSRVGQASQVASTTELEQTHNIQNERDKFYDNRNTLQLNPLEQAILRAEPLPHGEPDKAKTNLGDR